jgi:hypothetical protein
MIRWFKRGVLASTALACAGLAGAAVLVGLTTPLHAGETVPLTLRFERAGEVTIRIEVRAATAGNGSGAHY